MANILFLATGLLTQAALAAAPTLDANNQVGECISPTVSVWINAKAKSDWDPLPTVTVQNRIATDSSTTPRNVDPDNYPFGSRTVTVKACDHQLGSPQCTTKLVNVNVRDTLPPKVTPGRNLKMQCTSPSGLPTYVSTTGTPYCADTCLSNCPACANPSTANTSACTSCNGPCMSSCQGNPAYVALDKPSVSDICDPNAKYVTSAPPANFPIGNTLLSVTGFDFSGNVTNANVLVQVLDSVGPVFGNSVPSFNVVSHALTNDALSCQTSGGTPGTRVTLPHPNATDACTSASTIAYSWKLQGGQEDTSGNLCIPDGTNKVQFIARDGFGNADNGNTLATVVVGTQASYGLNLAVIRSPLGFVNRASNPNVYVTATAVSGSISGSVAWTAVGARPPDTFSTTANSYTAGFQSEGNFCPLYISGQDGANKKGASQPVCFAVDNTAPTQVYTAIPTASSWPRNGTPVLNPGTPLSLQMSAADMGGTVQSGVAQMTATVVDSSNNSYLLYNNTYCSNVGATANLPSCSTSYVVGGCNQVGTPYCLCPSVDGRNECTGDGRVNLASFPNGTYNLKIQVRDLAGNTGTQTYPFAVADLASAGSGGAPLNANSSLAGMIKLVMADPSTPSSAQYALQQALAYVNSASTMLTVSPGQAFVLAGQAYDSLDQALQNGANVLFHENYLSSLITGEVNRVLLQTQQSFASDLTPWPFLDGDPNAPPRYKAREFLWARNRQPRNYATDPNSTLILATKLSRVAAQHTVRGETRAAISSSIAVFDSLATLFRDSTFASLYGPLGYAVHPIAGVTPAANEAFFRGAIPSHFGDEIARTVRAQIQRYIALVQAGKVNGVSAFTALSLGQINSDIDRFTNAVAPIKDADWSRSNYSNMQLVNDVYLRAISALQRISGVSGAAVYTRYWQTGITYTLAQVVNFSVYAGPTALTCLLWGSESSGLPGNPNFFAGCSGITRVTNPPVILNASGRPQNSNPNSIDWEAQAAECRYNTMLYALADGRMTTTTASVGAADLFVSSQCLIVDLYNKYYAGGVYNPQDSAITLPSSCIRPALTRADALVDCGACTLGDPSTAVDNTCNGVDDDCNGLVDDLVAIPSCGCNGLPASQCPCASSADCRNGQMVDCVPGVPPTAVDLLCNSRDNNCDGQLAENYVPQVCGLGGCSAVSSCTNGVESTCVPITPAAEVCNGTDDNCNILVDEGLDADFDAFGCAPCQLYSTSATCGAVMGCVWNGSACVSLRSTSACNQCIPGRNGCTTSLLCANDVNNGTWTGQWDCDDTDPTIYPGNPEICDGKDNNCNGVIDEGVRNVCGTCDPACVATQVGVSGSPFTPNPVNSQNIAQDPNTGAIGLTNQNVNAQFAWVANDTAGTVSKIDTTNGKEVARYCQAIKTGVTSFASGKDPTGASYDTRAEPTVCGGCGGCNRGSRTAVDKSGNVFVANRAHDPTAYQGNYTKIAANAQYCVDVDGDGKIETSVDINGDGVINPNQNLPAATREYYGELDECILWTRRGTTWDGPVQPSCNTPGWPPNNAVADPGNITYTDEQTTCLNDPNSQVRGANGVCQWTNSCNGSGNSTCGLYTSATLCDPSNNGKSAPGGAWCTWNSTTKICAATPCSTSNNSKANCQVMSGCSWFQDCYNVAEGPLTNVGPTIPRALAIDPQGRPWLGLYNRRGFLQFNADTGAVQRWVYSGYVPYGAAIDKNGILWFPNGCCGNANLGSINTNPNTVSYVNPDNGTTTFTWTAYQARTHSASPDGSYGIAVDGAGHVFLGSYPSLTSAATRFDALRNTWATLPVTRNASGQRNPDAGVGRGLTVDASGTIWVAQHGDNAYGRLTGYNPDTLLPVMDIYMKPNGSIPIGVGVGYGGRIWTNNQSSKNVSVVDPATGSIAYFPVGGPPYTYSDFTGSILRTFTSPTGTYAEIINACYGFETNAWVSLVWQGVTPVGTANQGRTTSSTRLRFRMRGANVLVTRDSQGNPVDPSTSTKWSLWYPDDISDPTKVASDPNRVYYYEIQPSNKWPNSGVCAGQNSSTYTAATNSYNINGCADLAAVPVTYDWGQGPQSMLYMQIEANLLADADNTVQPSLMNFQVARTCPQF